MVLIHLFPGFPITKSNLTNSETKKQKNKQGVPTFRGFGFLGQVDRPRGSAMRGLRTAVEEDSLGRGGGVRSVRVGEFSEGRVGGDLLSGIGALL